MLYYNNTISPSRLDQRVAWSASSMKLPHASALLLIALPAFLLAMPRTDLALCTRSATLLACQDSKGNYYSVRSAGSTFYLRGYEVQGKRLWAQTNSRYGTLTSSLAWPAMAKPGSVTAGVSAGPPSIASRAPAASASICTAACSVVAVEPYFSRTPFMTSLSLSLPDIATQSSQHSLPLDWVGMCGIALPLQVEGRGLSAHASAGGQPGRRFCAWYSHVALVPGVGSARTPALEPAADSPDPRAVSLQPPGPFQHGVLAPGGSIICSNAQR
jgi:hypothetical protein